MEAASLFKVANMVAMVGWLLMALAPRWKGTNWIVHRGLLPVGLGVLYGVLMFVTWGQAKIDFSSLAGVKSLFQHDWLLLIGWVHYLAFDMFVGSWSLRDSWTRDIPHWWMLPILFLTFMFGPVGFVLYMGLTLFRPKVSPQEETNA